MSEPLKSDDAIPPMGGTRARANWMATLKAGSRRARIMQILSRGPAALFEIAREMNIPQLNAISGRLTELQRDGYVERTGERRQNPASGSMFDVYRIAAAQPEEDPLLLVYPLSVMLDGQLYDRQSLLAGAEAEGYPGIPYARRADTGGARLNVRIEFPESPCCGKPMMLWMDGQEKKFRCTGKSCSKVFRTRLVNEPGKGQLFALVMENF